MVVAAGNQVTCNMQGFFVTWHFIYFVTAYTALALLYWLIVKWNLSEEMMSRLKIQLAFGLPPILISLGFSLAPLFLEMYNIGKIHCTIMPYPASCFFNDIECTRGGNARALQLTKNGYALICGLAIVVFMSLLVYAVYSQEKKGDRYAVSSQHVTRTYTRKAGKFDLVICYFPSQPLQILNIILLSMERNTLFRGILSSIHLVLRFPYPEFCGYATSCTSVQHLLLFLYRLNTMYGFI